MVPPCDALQSFGSVAVSTNGPLGVAEVAMPTHCSPPYCEESSDLAV